jgi:vacuolar-type H+-ATPase subunit H
MESSMNAFEIVDRIEEFLDKSKRIPFSSNIIVNENEIYDLLDELRNILPEEFKQSRWIVKERENMIEEAKRYSEKVIREAKEKSEVLVSETEILKSANRKSEELMSAVEVRARTIRLEAEDYADEKLANLEAVLHKLLTAIERGREQFRSTPGSSDK